MLRMFPRVIILPLVIIGCATLGKAEFVPIGELTFDTNTGTAAAAFDITNLTGVNAFPPEFPIMTQLTITVTSLVADLQGGGTLTISGSDFSVVDPLGDVNCTVSGDAARGGCDLAAYRLTSATLIGTLRPITDLAGLPAGSGGIEDVFMAEITPNAGCEPAEGSGTTLTPGCDIAVINATTVPEQPTWTVIGGLISLLAGYKLKRSGEIS